MADNYDAAIADLQKEIADRMRTVNSLLSLKGHPPRYADVDGAFAITAGGIRSDQWYGSGLSTAAREFLEMRNASNLGAASVDEIFDALTQGGFKFEAKDKVNSKAALQQSLSKNTSIFHRLPNGRVGLADWYPAVRDGGDNQSSRKRTKHFGLHLRTGTKAKTGRRMKIPRSRRLGVEGTTGLFPGPKVTLQDSVKAGIKIAPNHFTKQDILDWVNKHYPSLKAKKASVFSMITHLRDEMGFEAVEKARGPQPGIYGKKAQSV